MMTDDRWKQVEALFHEAAELPPGERDAFLAGACGDDSELQQEVQSLLAQDGARDNIVELAVEQAATQFSSISTDDNPASKQIGPYRLIELLGQGGMGRVFKAYDTQLNRTVAIKALLPEHVADPQRRRRFLREAKAASALNHPNIVTIYGVINAPDTDFIVMEFVSGKTLDRVIPRRGLSLKDAIAYGAEIADALALAHTNGVVHCDIKPSNVIVTSAGHVKILDFGVAKLKEAVPTQKSDSAQTLTTQPGVLFGTASYMSPEQATGQPVDARSDLFSLGAVLYEMVTGKRAFQGGNFVTTLSAVLNEEPPRPRTLSPEIPLELERIVLRCLKKNPEQRIQHAVDVKLSLQDVLEQVDSPPAPPARRKRPLARISAWIVAAVLVVLGAAWSTMNWRGNQPASRQLLRLNLDLPVDAAPWSGYGVTVAISPDGTRLAYPMRGPNGKTELAAHSLKTGQRTLLSGTEAPSDPFFSPDGQWIGFFNDSHLKKVPFAGGSVVTLCDAPTERGAAWARDGYIVAALTTVGGLFRIPESGGSPQALTKPAEKGETTHRRPQILPDGKTVLFTGHTGVGNYEDANIEVLSLQTRQWKVVQRDGYFGRYLPSGHLVYVHQGTLFVVSFDPSRQEVRGAPVPLLNDIAAYPPAGSGQFDFSETGSFVYLAGKPPESEWTIAWLERTGKIEPLLASPGAYYTPRISPDGNRLVFAVRTPFGTDIQVYDWRENKVTKLSSPAKANLNPLWAPDGTHVVFDSQTEGGFSIRWVRSDGQGEPQVLVESESNIIPGSFSPDGRYLALQGVTSGTHYDLDILPLDLTDPEHPKPGRLQPLITGPSVEANSAFSPDGHWLAYASDVSGKMQVYVRRFDTGTHTPQTWQVSKEGGQYPTWSRNSPQLFFETLDNHIMVTDYSANGGSFTTGTPRLWTLTPILNGPARNLDITADAKRFVVFPRPSETDVHITLLENLFDDLRRRLPVGQ